MGAERIEAVFQKGKKAFIPYVMAGDGGLQQLQEHIRFFDKIGASVIEIGIPFSDPVADGKAIQQAGMRALQSGTTLSGIFAALKEVRMDVNIPFVMMTYLNPILAFGKERFVKECIEAGVDGIIVPDLPYEEQTIIAPLLQEVNIALIPLVTVTSPNERIQKITSEAKGFVYAVTVAGVTGVRRDFEQELHAYLQKVKEHVHLPVVAGFGISTTNQIEDLLHTCDGVVVGSRVIELLQEGNLKELEDLVLAVK